MNLNFTISELCKSETAEKNGIKNIPDLKALDNMLNLIVYLLQPLRDKIARPIIISSGYRCPQLNKLVKGVANSGHLKGTCADFVVRGMSVQELLNFICNSGINFTQLIEEHKGNTSWIHIEYDKQNLKKDKLKYINGKYIRL